MATFEEIDSIMYDDAGDKAIDMCTILKTQVKELSEVVEKLQKLVKEQGEMLDELMDEKSDYWRNSSGGYGLRHGSS